MPSQYPTICPQRALMFINKLDAIKQLEFESTETHHTVGSIGVRQQSSILANISAYKQNN